MSFYFESDAFREYISHLEREVRGYKSKAISSFLTVALTIIFDIFIIRNDVLLILSVCIIFYNLTGFVLNSMHFFESKKNLKEAPQELEAELESLREMVKTDTN